MLEVRNLIAGVLLFLALVLLGAPSKLRAQNTQPTQTPQPPPQPTQTPPLDCDAVKKSLGLSKTPDFLEITNTRDEITSDVARLEQEITELAEQMPFAPTERELAEARRKASEKQKGQPDKGTAGTEKPAPDIDVNQPSEETLKQELKIATDKLNARKLQQRCIQQTIASINTPEQTFKSTVSFYFALLIGMVILGFFVLSYKDEKIRQAIFSGQTGIQFLTLFSIVIAIILFGVTNILQDKELAALLGGLSGYILGRYSNPSENVNGARPAPSQSAAPENKPPPTTELKPPPE